MAKLGHPMSGREEILISKLEQAMEKAVKVYSSELLATCEKFQNRIKDLEEAIFDRNKRREEAKPPREFKVPKDPSTDKRFKRSLPITPVDTLAGNN